MYCHSEFVARRMGPTGWISWQAAQVSNDFIVSLIRELLLIEIAILVCSSATREVLFQLHTRVPGWRVRIHEDWNRQWQVDNLARLGVHEDSASTGRGHGFIELGNIKRAVRRHHLREVWFWRIAGFLSNLGGGLLRFPILALKKPLPWLLAAVIACFRAWPKIPEDAGYLHVLDTWRVSQNPVAVVLPALTLLAIAYALFFRKALGSSLAREEAQKAANAELLGLGGELLRLAYALNDHVKDLARYRSVVLERWVMEASGGRYIWSAYGVERANRTRPVFSPTLRVSGISETYETMIHCADDVYNRCDSIAKQGLVAACTESTMPVFQQCNELSLFRWRDVDREQFRHTLVLRGYRSKYDELAKEFEYAAKSLADGDLDAIFEAVVRTGPISVAGIRLIRNVIKPIVGYRRALVEKSHALVWYLDVLLVDGEEAALNCIDVAVYLINRATHESNSSRLYKAIRGK